MTQPLRILFVEDLPTDQELATWQLREGGLDFISQRVDTRDGFLQALHDFQPDLIISDYAMPEFDGMQALKLSQELKRDIPFIVLTGSMNEETAANCIKAGARVQHSIWTPDSQGSDVIRQVRLGDIAAQVCFDLAQQGGGRSRRVRFL